MRNARRKSRESLHQLAGVEHARFIRAGRTSRAGHRKRPAALRNRRWMIGLGLNHQPLRITIQLRLLRISFLSTGFYSVYSDYIPGSLKPLIGLYSIEQVQDKSVGSEEIYFLVCAKSFYLGLTSQREDGNHEIYPTEGIKGRFPIVSSQSPLYGA